MPGKRKVIDISELMNDWNNDVDNTILCEKYGFPDVACLRAYVYRHRKRGYDFKVKCTRLSDEDKAKIFEMHEKGMELKYIAKSLGVNYATVRQLIFSSQIVDMTNDEPDLPKVEPYKPKFTRYNEKYVDVTDYYNNFYEIQAMRIGERRNERTK